MMRPLHKTRLLLRFVVCATTFSHAFAQTQSAPTKMQQALAYEKQGDFSAAEKIWSELATDNPSNSDAWAHLGLIRALKGNYSEAVIAYREALQLHSHLPGLE